jgi:hypothetical protein
MKVQRLAVLIAFACAVVSLTRAAEFSAGFNDGSGINSNATPDSPYALDLPVTGMGLGEAGWDGGWIGPNGPGDERLVQGDVVYEGDGALELFGFPTSAERLFAEPQTGIMTVSLRICITQMLGEAQGDRDFIFRFGDEDFVDTRGQPHLTGKVKDLNKDRRLDLLLEFDLKQLVNSGAITFDTTTLALKAATESGEVVIGFDSMTFTRK